MSHFNAILIGGPPHSGKSVLTYSLSQTLRQQGIDHYVLRACPDGEGDWSNEAPPDTVRLIRQKGRFTPEFVQRVAADLRRRHLPLLVDAGGRPQEDQEIILAQCTHAILIAQDEAGLALWRPLVERNGLHIVAELLSLREGCDALLSDGRNLRAHLTGLERHHQIKGPVFDALALCAATYLYEPPALLRLHHLDSAPVELAVDLQDVARQLGLEGESPFWTPSKLPELLAYLPAGVSTGVYGRAPNWVFAALALHAQGSPFYQFDVRLGWVTPPPVSAGEVRASEVRASEVRAGEVRDSEERDSEERDSEERDSEVLSLQVVQGAGHQLLGMMAPGYYIDYEDCGLIRAPAVDRGQGLVLSGRVPHWLMAGMALAYGGQPWVAVYQPPLRDKAVVVASRTAGVAIGDLVVLDQAVLAQAQGEPSAKR